VRRGSAAEAEAEAGRARARAAAALNASSGLYLKRTHSIMRTHSVEREYILCRENENTFYRERKYSIEAGLECL
jgi:hypothetical protein